MTLYRLTPPAAPPLDLATAKLYARLDGSDLDAILTGQLAAAVEAVEAATRRALLAQTWRQIADDACGGLRLERWPVLDVVEVSDERGPLTAGDDYTIRQRGPDDAVIEPVAGWQGSVFIDYRAGYGDTGADVPAPLVSAVALRFVALVDLDQAGACERAAAALEAPYWVPRL